MITQAGFQLLTDGESMEPVETVSAGDYYYRNGSHYLLFDETTEGFDEATHTMMKFNDSRLLVHKRGLINVEMIFEKEKKTSSFYDTPMGRLEIGLAATNFVLKESMEQIDYQVDYALSIGGEFIADCQVKMRVQPRLKGMFSLTS